MLLKKYVALMAERASESKESSTGIQINFAV